MRGHATPAALRGSSLAHWGTKGPRMPGDTFHWLDVEIIAEELAEEHPQRDPLSISFPELKTLVQELEGFEEQQGHPCNERILEAIQAEWIKERADAVGDDDEDDDD
jgi:FeS assembly protein IscX